MAEIALSVGDLALRQQQSNLRKDVTSAWQNAQYQVSSGQKARTYDQNALNVQESIKIKTTISSIDQYKRNIQTADMRLSRAEGSLDIIMKTLSEFRTRLTGAVQPGNADTSFGLFCQNALEEIAQQLNVTDNEGNNIFGGTMWKGQVVDLSRLPVPTLGGAISAAYYQGDDGQLVVNVGGTQTQDYTFRANDPGLSKMLAALKTGATITPDYIEGGNNMLMLRQAMGYASEATEEVAALYESLGNTRANLNNQTACLDTLRERFIEEDATLNNVDPLEAWVSSMQYQTQLEMIMAIITQNSQMTKNTIGMLSR